LRSAFLLRNQTNGGGCEDACGKICSWNRRGRRGRTKGKGSKRKRAIRPQTNEPFEQDAKRRIGSFGGNITPHAAPDIVASNGEGKEIRPECFGKGSFCWERPFASWCSASDTKSFIRGRDLAVSAQSGGELLATGEPRGKFRSGSGSLGQNRRPGNSALDNEIRSFACVETSGCSLPTPGELEAARFRKPEAVIEWIGRRPGPFKSHRVSANARLAGRKGIWFSRWRWATAAMWSIWSNCLRMIKSWTLGARKSSPRKPFPHGNWKSSDGSERGGDRATARHRAEDCQLTRPCGRGLQIYSSRVLVSAKDRAEQWIFADGIERVEFLCLRQISLERKILSRFISQAGYRCIDARFDAYDLRPGARWRRCDWWTWNEVPPRNRRDLSTPMRGSTDSGWSPQSRPGADRIPWSYRFWFVWWCSLLQRTG